MEISAGIDIVSERVRTALADYTAPSLLPLPRLEVSVDSVIDDRQVRILGEAIYAAHQGDRERWAVIVEESNLLAPGTVRLIDVADLRVVVGPGSRGA